MSNSIIFFTFVSTLSSIVLSMIFGSLTKIVALISILIGFIVAIKMYEKEQYLFFTGDLLTKLIKFVLFIGISIVGTYHFLYLFYKSETAWKTLNPNNFGDLPFHIGVIKNIARGAAFWPENPIMSGERMRYPFGSDQFNALFEILGIPTQIHLFLVGFIFLFLFIFVLWKYMGYWGIIVFFLSGGGLNLISGSAWKPGDDVVWKNLFLSVFVTQRGFMMALPVGVVLIYELIIKNRFLIKFISSEGAFEFRKNLKWFFLLGALSIFHLNTFIFLLIFIFGIYFLNKRWDLILKVFLPSLLLGLPFFVNSIWGGSQLTHNFGLSWGWTWKGQENYFFYLFKNFLFWLIIPLILIFHSTSNKFAKFIKNIFKWRVDQLDREQKLIVFLIFILNILVWFTRTTPWDWDQIKFLLWVYLLWNIYFYEFLLKEKSFHFKSFLALFLFFPGFYHLSSSLPSKTASLTLYHNFAILEAQKIIQLMDPQGVVALAPHHDHEFIYSGAKVLMGHSGHLYSHGYQVGDREAHLVNIMKGNSSWKSEGEALKVKYIVWGNREKNHFKLTDPIWQKELPIIYQSPNWTVYLFQTDTK